MINRGFFTVEEVISRAKTLLFGEWIEFPVDLQSSDMACDRALIPRRIVILKLPEKKELLEILRSVWGWNGFRL